MKKELTRTAMFDLLTHVKNAPNYEKQLILKKAGISCRMASYWRQKLGFSTFNK